MHGAGGRAGVASVERIRHKDLLSRLTGRGLKDVCRLHRISRFRPRGGHARRPARRAVPARAAAQTQCPPGLLPGRLLDLESLPTLITVCYQLAIMPLAVISITLYPFCSVI